MGSSVERKSGATGEATRLVARAWIDAGSRFQLPVRNAEKEATGGRASAGAAWSGERPAVPLDKRRFSRKA